MTFIGRHLISINDFSNEEIEAVLDLAQEMDSALEAKKRLDLCQGKELYTIFYEPSTRTRSSFETAMHRLGGTVVSHAEAQVTSSVAKGETTFQVQKNDQLFHIICYITQLKLTPLQVGLSGNILQHLKPGGINEPDSLQVKNHRGALLFHQLH